MQVNYNYFIVKLPSDFFVGDMIEPQTYWTVPVELNWSVVDNGKSNVVSGMVKVRVNGPRSMSVDDVQQKAGEYIKFTFSLGENVVITYQ